MSTDHGDGGMVDAEDPNTLLPAGTNVEGVVTYKICDDGKGCPYVVRTGNSIVYKASASRVGSDEECYYALKLATRNNLEPSPRSVNVLFH